MHKNRVSEQQPCSDIYTTYTDLSLNILPIVDHFQMVKSETAVTGVLIDNMMLPLQMRCKRSRFD